MNRKITLRSGCGARQSLVPEKSTEIEKHFSFLFFWKAQSN